MIAPASRSTKSRRFIHSPRFPGWQNAQQAQLALAQRQRSQVNPIDPQQIERDIGGRQPAAEKVVKLRPPGRVDDHLAVEHRGHVRPIETVQSPRPCQTDGSGGVSTPWIENGEPLPANAWAFLTVRADVWCAAFFASWCSVPRAGNRAAGADGICA